MSVATDMIQTGEWVHTKNVKTNLGGVEEYSYKPKFTENRYQKEPLTFKGFKRKDGKTGIRNELWIVPQIRFHIFCMHPLPRLNHVSGVPDRKAVFDDVFIFSDVF